jgi:hypothetical protein
MSLYNQDLRAELTTLTGHVTLERLLEMFDMLQQLCRYLSMNLNSQLLFEQLLVQLSRTLTRTHTATRAPAAPPAARKHTHRSNA